MAEIWAQVWDWLGVEDNRARIAIIIAVLGFIGAALKWLLGRFKVSSGGGQTGSGGSVNVGGNVGGDVTTGGRKDGTDAPS